jgi:hypothetical protein
LSGIRPLGKPTIHIRFIADARCLKSKVNIFFFMIKVAEHIKLLDKVSNIANFFQKEKYVASDILSRHIKEKNKCPAVFSPFARILQKPRKRASALPACPRNRLPAPARELPLADARANDCQTRRKRLADTPCPMLSCLTLSPFLRPSTWDEPLPLGTARPGQEKKKTLFFFDPLPSPKSNKINAKKKVGNRVFSLAPGPPLALAS